MDEHNGREAPRPGADDAASRHGAAADDVAAEAPAPPPPGSGPRRRLAPAPEILIFLATLAAAGTTALAALKLTGVVDWPWPWVLSPLWGVFAAILLFSLVFGLAAVLATLAGRSTRRPGAPPHDRK